MIRLQPRNRTSAGTATNPLVGLVIWLDFGRILFAQPFILAMPYAPHAIANWKGDSLGHERRDLRRPEALDVIRSSGSCQIGPVTRFFLRLFESLFMPSSTALDEQGLPPSEALRAAPREVDCDQSSGRSSPTEHTSRRTVQRCSTPRHLN
jgi:hypothetical protein